MLGSLILGAAAGAFAPKAEDQVKTLLETTLFPDAPLAERELSAMTFALLLFGAALVTFAFGDGSGIALTFGAVLGVFAERIQRVWRKRREPDYGDDI